MLSKEEFCNVMSHIECQLMACKEPSTPPLFSCAIAEQPPPQMSEIEAEAYHTAFNSLRRGESVSRE